MFNNLEWFSLIILLGALQGLMLFVSVMRLKKGSIKTNKFLAFFILVISVTLLGRFYYTSPNISLAEYKVLFLGDLIIFLYGPLLYFYLIKLFSLKSKLKTWIHFIPVALYTIFTLPFLVADREGFIELSRNIGDIFRIMEIFAILQNLFYLILNWRTLNNFEKESELTLSYSYQIKFYKWIQILIVIALASWIFSLVVSEFGPDYFSGYLGYHLVWIVLSGAVIALGYYTMNNPEIFNLEVNLKKSENSVFNNEQLIQLSARLEEIMNSAKPYLEPKLTLAELADKCGLSTHQLSRVINERYEKNFFEYINSFRVEEFKHLVKKDPAENLTLLAVAYQSGFNSKTTFNTAFKKITSQTPKEYLKSIKAA